MYQLKFGSPLGYPWAFVLSFLWVPSVSFHTQAALVSFALALPALSKPAPLCTFGAERCPPGFPALVCVSSRPKPGQPAGAPSRSQSSGRLQLSHVEKWPGGERQFPPERSAFRCARACQIGARRACYLPSFSTEGLPWRSRGSAYVKANRPFVAFYVVLDSDNWFH